MVATLQSSGGVIKKVHCQRKSNFWAAEERFFDSNRGFKAYIEGIRQPKIRALCVMVPAIRKHAVCACRPLDQCRDFFTSSKLGNVY